MADIYHWENEGGAISRVSLSPRLTALKRQHRRMHALIDLQAAKPDTCEIELRRLKRQKLYLKDQINSLAAHRS